MKRIKLNELSNIIFLNSKEDIITGYTTDKRKDILGIDYELLKEEQKYIYLFSLEKNRFYLLELFLLDRLLLEDIKLIQSGEIYDHGYPESRLILSNHYETCRESFLNTLKEEFCDKIETIISDYF